MGKQKVTQTASNTVNHGWMNTPVTQAMLDVKEKAKIDPSIPYGYSQRREQLNNSYANPLGSYTSPAVRDAANRNAGQALTMAEHQATAEAQRGVDDQNYQRNLAFAQMTAPQLVQTGSSSQGTETRPSNFWSNLGGGILSGAGGALA